ncbi:hypothetical protein ANN_27113 [Periplaneta americana]|uniref:Major facilitator superfamily (MFS) profile domain-containing protein n=1 Tax=Periplaneta americana TaxID=6978 RepID=A0ABQ8RX67_PERAM|nr:hypothetical protein ANN_27113 [Periplaneta americana]
MSILRTTFEPLTEEPRGKSIPEGKKLTQYLAAIFATLGSMAVGTVLAWTSPVLPELQAANSTLPVTLEEGSWIGSLLAVGAIAGSLPAGYLADRFGRKIVICATSAPFLISWALVVGASSVAMLYVARLLAGLATGVVSVVAPVYTSEVAETSVRGALGTLFQIIKSRGPRTEPCGTPAPTVRKEKNNHRPAHIVGVLEGRRNGTLFVLKYTIVHTHSDISEHSTGPIYRQVNGYYMEMTLKKMNHGIQISNPAFVFVTEGNHGKPVRLPTTGFEPGISRMRVSNVKARSFGDVDGGHPVHLRGGRHRRLHVARHHQRDRPRRLASHVLQNAGVSRAPRQGRQDGCRQKGAPVLQRPAIRGGPRTGRPAEGGQGCIAGGNVSAGSGVDPGARRALVVGLGLMVFQQLSGINAVIFYSVDIFEAAGSTLDPKVAAIIVGVVQVVMSYAASAAVDRAGRRILLLVSASVMALCLALLGFYFCLEDAAGLGWLPLVCVTVFIIVFSLGFGPLPWMMMAELFAPRVKGNASSVAVCTNWTLVFLVTFSFGKLVAGLGEHTTFWIFAAICACATVFVWRLVPETKGKSLDEIQRLLSGERA